MTDSPFVAFKTPHLAEGCWPTREQALLLHAALSEHGQAIAAWRQWNDSFDLEQDHIDIGSYRLMPLIYKHLLRENVDEPHIRRLQGLYKRTWYENQMRFRAYANVLHAFHRAGIKTLLLKGYPLAIHYYGDLGVRPMADMDLLVPKHRVFQAIQVLSELGWSAIEDFYLSEATLDLKPSHGLHNAEGVQLDLHWHVLHYCPDEQMTARFWEASVPLEINGVTTLALNPADQLLHACAHGLMWNMVPPIRWIADALYIINSAAAGIDWNRLASLAIPCNASLQLHAALSYLRTEFQAEIPEKVITDLEMANTTHAQKGLFAALTSGGIWGSLRLLWYGFLVTERYKESARNPFAFMEYVRVITGKKNSWQVFRWAVSRVSIRLSEQLSSFWRRPESSPIKQLDPGFRRGDE